MVEQRLVASPPRDQPIMVHTVSYTPTDFTRMPWKNGGGQTTELVRNSPDGDYSWRLSLADIDLNGPFSSFP